MPLLCARGCGGFRRGSGVSQSMDADYISHFRKKCDSFFVLLADSLLVTADRLPDISVSSAYFRYKSAVTWWSQVWRQSRHSVLTSVQRRVKDRPSVRDAGPTWNRDLLQVRLRVQVQKVVKKSNLVKCHCTIYLTIWFLSCLLSNCIPTLMCINCIIYNFT